MAAKEIPQSIHTPRPSTVPIKNMYWEAHNAVDQGSLTFRLGFIIQAAKHSARTMFCTILEKKLGFCCAMMFRVSSHSTRPGRRLKSDVTRASTGNGVNRCTKYPWVPPKTLLDPRTNRIGIFELLSLVLSCFSTLNHIEMHLLFQHDSWAESELEFDLTLIIYPNWID